jgi:hypothetical protein
MGLALDEPREGDEDYQVDDLKLIVDPFALKLIKESGGLNIKSGVFGPAAELESSVAGGCGCS